MEIRSAPGVNYIPGVLQGSTRKKHHLFFLLSRIMCGIDEIKTEILAYAYEYIELLPIDVRLYNTLVDCILPTPNVDLPCNICINMSVWRMDVSVWRVDVSV